MQVNPSTSNNQSIDDQITFDKQEIATLESQMEAQGLGEFFIPNTVNPSTGNEGTFTTVPEGTAAGAVFVPINRVVQTIAIPAFSAQAGQINIYGDEIQGVGVLDAPTSANVGLINTTEATPDIEGINIPQLIGGVYVNGIILQGTVASANSAINTGNHSDAQGDNKDPQSNTDTELVGVAAFSDVTLQPPPVPPAKPGDAVNATAFITIQNLTPALPTAPNVQGGPTLALSTTPPDILITGSITAIEANLTVVSQNNIDISAPLIDVNTQNFQAKNNISISTVVFNASGDPASQLLPFGDDSLDALGTSGLLIPDGPSILGGTTFYYSSTPSQGETVVHQYEQQVQQTTFLAQSIEIQAEYVNLNGVITAGTSNATLTINQSDIQQQIDTIKADGLAGVTPLLLSTKIVAGQPAPANPNDEFAVGYDPANGGSLVVSDVSLAGGIIIIKGQVYSTSQAELNSFGYYGDVTINNNTNLNLAVNNINVGQPGAGPIEITDYNKTYSGNSNYVLETTYQSVQGGGMQVQTQYVNGQSGALLGSGGGITSINLGAPTQYSLESGLRYEFQVVYGTQTTTTRTYHSSHWIGAFHLGSGTDYSSNTVPTGQPQILASSERFVLDTNGNDPTTDYIYTTQTNVASTTGFTPGANWSTSTWYGKHTYYQQTVDVTNDQTVSTDSIRADIPININFLGGTQANITITSGGNVTLLGNLSNSNGTTSITAGGTITQPNPASTVQGVVVNLNAQNGIGQSGSPAIPATSTTTATPATFNAVNVVLAAAVGLIAAPTSAIVDFANVTVAGATAGTITLTQAALQAGANWNNYTVGEGVFVQSTSPDLSLDPYANGTAFNPSVGNAYYTIGAINGATITLNQALLGTALNPALGTLETNVTVGLAPVNLNLSGSAGLTGTPTATQVNYSGNNITLTDPNGTWSAYTVGEGIYIGSGINNTGTFNPNSTQSYYTISAINGTTLTVNHSLTTGTNVTANVAPVSIGQSLSAHTGNGNIYIAAPTTGLAINSVTAGGDMAVNLSTIGAIVVATGDSGLIGGGNVTVNSGGIVGTSAANIQLAVGQAANDQFNLSAKGDVYLTQANGNLPLFAVSTSGSVFLTLGDGSLVNVNTNVTVDPRTVSQLENGVWSQLQLTGAQYDAKVQQTVNEYQLSQQNQYRTYWNYLDNLVNGQVQLSAADLAYYTGVYTAQGTAQNLTGSALTSYVSAAIQTLQISETQQYFSLAAEFGPGGTYNPSPTGNAYNAATQSDISVSSTTSAQTIAAAVIYGNVNSLGTLTLAAGGNWSDLGYVAGQGIYIGTASDPNSNGATFSATGANPYYTIQSVSGSVITLTTALKVNDQATVNIAPVAINSQNPNQSTASSTTSASVDFQSGPAATQVSFQNGITPTTVNVDATANTITLANGGSWTALGYSAGEGIYVGSSTDANSNGATFNPTSGNPYYTIASVNGAVLTLTLQAGQTLTAEANVTVNLAAVAISGTNGSTSTLQPATITLSNGGSWSALGYTVGQGIFVGSPTDANANGAVFNVGATNPYYTITAINGDVVNVVGQNLTGETNVTVNLAPVAISGTNGSTSTLQTMSTITLTNGGTWSALGYTVGEGIFVGSSTDPNSNGSVFNASGNNPYYTIAAISGSVLTLLKWRKCAGLDDAQPVAGDDQRKRWTHQHLDAGYRQDGHRGSDHDDGGPCGDADRNHREFRQRRRSWHDYLGQWHELVGLHDRAGDLCRLFIRRQCEWRDVRRNRGERLLHDHRDQRLDHHAQSVAAR